MDILRSKTRRIESLKRRHPGILKDETVLEPDPINWQELRELANAIFEPSDLFMTAFRQLCDSLREQTFKAVRESERTHRDNPDNEPIIYFPSADWSERLRQQIPDIIIQSAALDFLLSPLANDGKIEALVKEPIILNPLSLWRGFLVGTTVGPGETRLLFKKPEEKEKKTASPWGGTLDIDFGWTMSPETARDQREGIIIKTMLAEQVRFKNTFLRIMEEVSKQMSLAAQHSIVSGNDTVKKERHNFERLISLER